MRKLWLVLLLLLTPVAYAAKCSEEDVSITTVEGIGTVYRYQGRANFAHQMAEADRLMTDDCKARNGGRPVIVDLQKRDLGVIAVNSGQASTRLNATAAGNSNSTNVTGTATTTSSGSTTAMRNYNQEILYKCVTE